MPKMNGLDTLKVIKQKYNIPVIMVSSVTRKGADITIKALEMGAVDWIQKPENTFDSKVYEQLANELIQKVKLLAKPDGATPAVDKHVPQVAPAISHTTPVAIDDKDNMTSAAFTQFVLDSRWKPKGGGNVPFYLVAIGISTGGPSALNQVVTQFPEDMNAAVLIVQHMPATFTKVLADRLDNISKVKVKEAEENEVIKRGVVYIIPGDKHIRILDNDPNRLTIKLDHYSKVGGFRPSAEPLFYFVAEVAKKKAVGVIMTGMGGDGSDNLGLIKAYSGKTIAQDEASCVIFGMPKMAIMKGHVDTIVPLDKIVDKIKDYIVE